MDMKSATYLVFYELLIESFKQYVETELKRPLTKAQINNIWFSRAESSEAHIGEYFSIIKFDIKRNPDYFFDKYYGIINPRKTPDRVTINDTSLYKALILIGVTFPTNFILDKLSKLERTRMFGIVIEEFQKKYASNIQLKIEFLKQKNIDQQQNAGYSLSHTVYDINLPEFELCETILQKFCKTVIEQQYLDAWNLLSPRFHKRSFWDGDFYKFESGVSPLKNIEINGIEDMSYAYKEIKCTVYSTETISIFKLNEIMTVAELLSSKKDLTGLSILQKIYLHLSRASQHILPNESDKESIFIDYDFQKFIFSSTPRLFSQILQYISSEINKSSVKREIKFAFVANRWLIDDISNFQPLSLKDLVKLYDSRRT